MLREIILTNVFVQNTAFRTHISTFTVVVSKNQEKMLDLNILIYKILPSFIFAKLPKAKPFFLNNLLMSVTKVHCFSCVLRRTENHDGSEMLNLELLSSMVSTFILSYFHCLFYMATKKLNGLRTPVSF